MNKQILAALLNYAGFFMLVFTGNHISATQLVGLLLMQLSISILSWLVKHYSHKNSLESGKLKIGNKIYGN